MNEILGTTWPVLVGLTVAVAGTAAFLTGQAVARTWQPAWRVVAYAALLAVADRFLHFALFDGRLLAPWGFVASALILSAIGLAAYRMTRARKMSTQYPWEYERAGLFGWRRIAEGPSRRGRE